MPTRRTDVSEVAAKKAPVNSHARRTRGHKRKLQPGQPCVTSKLTDALTERLCAEIRRGLPYGTCCRLVHLGERSFENWMARAEVEMEEGKHSEYVDFYYKVREANAEAQRTVHALVLESNPTLILTRRWPKDYPSERQLLELSGAGGSPLVPPTVRIITEQVPPVEFPFVDESSRGPGSSVELVPSASSSAEGMITERVSESVSMSSANGAPGRLSMVLGVPKPKVVPDFASMSVPELNDVIRALRTEVERRKQGSP